MKTKRFVWFILLLAMMVGINSCRKNDHSVQSATENKGQWAVVNSFLKTNDKTALLTRSVAEEIARREHLRPFVYEFAQKNGMPVWEKAIVTYPGSKQLQHNYAGTTAESLVYIPLVIPGVGQTNGFIRAVINDSISLSYCLAKDYKNYPANQVNGVTTAAEFATLLMMMDHTIFGVSDFTITDSRLFAEPGQSFLPGISRSARIREIVSGVNTGANLCEGTMYTISWLVQDPPNCPCANGASNGGICQAWFTGCPACSNTVSVTINTGTGSCAGGGGEGPIGGRIPVGGGPSGGGTGSGGGQIPPYYPCSGGGIPTDLLPEPLPPCPPPGGGVGWTIPAVLLSVDASAVIDLCLQSLIQSIGQPGHYSYILKAYANQQLSTAGVQKKYKVRYLTNNNLIGNNGQPVPASTFVNTLADGTNEVVVTLNPSLFQNSTKEWVASVILHELYHGILIIEKPELSTQPLQHSWMFNNLVPLTIGQSIEELFPSINLHHAIALGMGGISEGYLIAGTNIIDPAKDAFSLINYSQNINQAIYTETNFQNAVIGFGTPFC